MKVPIIIYVGEWDERDGPASQEHWIRNLRELQGSKTQLFDSPRELYWFKNAQGYMEVGGYFHRDQDKGFTLMTTPKAGHFVPMTQRLMTI